MIGNRLGHYEIVEPLGSGGMGEVWVARDTRLGRQVALKLLPPDVAADAERLDRFEREAKTLATLNHPGIVTIFSVEEAAGKRFMTMELVEGRTLSQAIPAEGLAVADFLALAVPLTDAVAAAHARGVQHRDLKPANVMVSGDGRVKVLDFGLAKLRQESHATDGFTQLRTSDLTAEGKILGTIAYMSPEQAEGQAVDHRSDIFSLGILLYEMATGERPFRGETNLSILSSILKDEPRSVSEMRGGMPLAIARVIQRALAKRPEQRYQSAADLRQDLADIKRDIDTGEALATGLYSGSGSTDRPGTSRNMRLVTAVVGVAALVAAAGWAFSNWRGADAPLAVDTLPARSDLPGVAVFFFDNISGDAELDWLRTGLTDMLVTDLSQAPNLRVLGTDRLQTILGELGRLDDRATAFDVVSEVARRARMGTAIVGSFAKSGDQVRINARVQDATTGDVLASESVSGNVDEIFTLVGQLSDAIAARFAMPQMTPQTEAMLAEAGMMDRRSLAEVATRSLEAYRLYVEGENLKNDSRELDAIPLLRRAVELDPEFAMAHAKLSVAYGNSGQVDLEREAARRAFELADRLSPRDRYYVRGRYFSMTPDTIDQALDDYGKAVELFPDHMAARNNLALNLMSLQRFDEAARQLEVLRDLRHEFVGTYTNLAEVYSFLGRDGDAASVLKEYIEREPAVITARTALAQVFAMAGRFDEALQAADDAIALGAGWEARGVRAAALAANDRWDEARAEVERIAADPAPRAPMRAAYMLAQADLLFGRLDEAIARLRTAESASNDTNARLEIMQKQGQIYRLLGRGEDMLRTAEQMRQIDPDGSTRFANEIAFLDLAGNAFLGREESARAAGDGLWQKIQRLPLPGVVRRRFRSEIDAAIALATGDYETSVRELQAAVDAQPENARLTEAVEARYRLAELLWDAGRHDEAVPYLTAIATDATVRLELPIAAMRANWHLGGYHVERGEMDTARPYLETFLRYWGDGQIDREQVESAREMLR